MPAKTGRLVPHVHGQSIVPLSAGTASAHIGAAAFRRSIALAAACVSHGAGSSAKANVRRLHAKFYLALPEFIAFIAQLGKDIFHLLEQMSPNDIHAVRLPIDGRVHELLRGRVVTANVKKNALGKRQSGVCTHAYRAHLHIHKAVHHHVHVHVHFSKCTFAYPYMPTRLDDGEAPASALQHSEDALRDPHIRVQHGDSRYFVSMGRVRDQWHWLGEWRKARATSWVRCAAAGQQVVLFDCQRELGARQR